MAEKSPLDKIEEQGNIHGEIATDKEESTHGEAKRECDGAGKNLMVPGQSAAVEGQEESSSPIKPYVYLNIKEFESFDKVKANSENNDWVADITASHNAFRSLVVALFYRPNIPVALRLFKQIPELVGNHDMDLAIIRAECEVVMKDKSISLTLSSLRGLIVSKKPKFKPSDIREWDKLMKVKGRFLGRILLRYAAYCRYTSMDSGFYHHNALGDVTVDMQMRSIHLCLARIADIFLEIENSTIRDVAAGVVLQITLEMVDETKSIDSSKYKSRPYLLAVCYNYLAWIRLNTGDDEKCFKATDEGLKALKKYKGDDFQIPMLRADLLANTAIALRNLKDIDTWHIFHDKAKSLYEKCEDGEGMLKELEKAKLFD